jgi:putative flippase GtrA
VSERRRFARFVANGLAATAIHFSVLYSLREFAEVPSAGLANFLAAVPGITASFLGNRFFVFRASHAPWGGQAGRFVALYAGCAVMHGLALYLWTDLAGLDYRVGFVLATGLQIAISYVGNRLLVFR